MAQHLSIDALFIDMKPAIFPGIIRFDVDLNDADRLEKEGRLRDVHVQFPSLFIQVCPSRRTGVLRVAVLTGNPELAAKVSKWVNKGSA